MYYNLMEIYKSNDKIDGWENNIMNNIHMCMFDFWNDLSSVDRL